MSATGKGHTMDRVLRTVRTGRWLRPDLVTAAGRVALVLYVLTFAALCLVPNPFLSADGRFLSVDFLSFWTAAREALAGRSSLPYDPEAFRAVQAAVSGLPDFFSFFYPPMWLLVLLPFGGEAFFPAFLIFAILSLLVFLIAILQIVPERKNAILFLTLPVVFFALMHGQNALFSAALLGFAFVQMEKGKLVWAGIFIGLLTYKPQLGVLIPLALIAAGYGLTFLAAAVTAVLFAAASWLAFGTATWQAFLAQAPFATQVLEQGLVEWTKMVSVFAAVRSLGGSVSLAWGVQIAVGIVMQLMVLRVWFDRSESMTVRSAVLVAGGLLATPFALGYDLVVLAIPIAFIVRDASHTGFMPWEKTLLAVVIAMSASTPELAVLTGLPVSPLLPLAILWLGWRRRGVAGNEAQAVAF